MKVYLLITASNMGIEEPEVFYSFEDAQEALKKGYEDLLEDYEEENEDAFFDSELYDDSAYIETFENRTSLQIYDVDIKV
jgi:hypothetical protein